MAGLTASAKATAGQAAFARAVENCHASGAIAKKPLRTLKMPDIIWRAFGIRNTSCVPAEPWTVPGIRGGKIARWRRVMT